MCELFTPYFAVEKINFLMIMFTIENYKTLFEMYKLTIFLSLNVYNLYKY